MQAIPDTGGGFSGFVAHALWQVYRYFPFSGTWDWLVLILVLAGLVRLVFLPHLWKAIQADMVIFSEQKVLSDSENSSQDVWSFLWGTSSMWLLVWFFHTEAGRTLLDGRAWLGNTSPSEVGRGLFWLSLVAHAVVLFSFGGLSNSVEERNKSFAWDRSRPYPDRRLLSLLGGGGAIVKRAQQGGLKSEWIVCPAGVEAGFAFLAHAFYWYWSITSVMVMLSFLLTGLLAEAARVGFVYLLHKKTFG